MTCKNKAYRSAIFPSLIYSPVSHDHNNSVGCISVSTNDLLMIEKMDGKKDGLL